MIIFRSRRGKTYVVRYCGGGEIRGRKFVYGVCAVFLDGVEVRLGVVVLFGLRIFRFYFKGRGRVYGRKVIY